MKNVDRRDFLAVLSAGLGATVLPRDVTAPAPANQVVDATAEGVAVETQDRPAAIDFRYAPLAWQTAYCFPDDHHKSLIGQLGELRYGNPGRGKPLYYFPEIVKFSLLGMEADKVASQQLEAPGVPIVHTRIDRPEAYLELTTFATNDPAEGRVDNVIMEVWPRTQKELHATPLLEITTGHELQITSTANTTTVNLGEEAGSLFLVINTSSGNGQTGAGDRLVLKDGVTSGDRPLTYFCRFPQEGQGLERLADGLKRPEHLLASARDYWQAWSPYGGKVSWHLPDRYGQFLVACARNIQQAREVRDGKLTFQVGPTVYRGLWIVDGNFILEAARYLGYDADAQQGLETEWSRQNPDGQIVASAGREHWKDTGIAMFTMVRQAELSQDWSYFRKMTPNVLRAVDFLRDLRAQAREGKSLNGKYGLLPPGFGDGGLGGIQDEFTNTLWVLAGLRAVTRAADRLKLPEFESTGEFYHELRSSFFAAARKEMRRYKTGFEYLPMLMNEDPAWSLPNKWDRPRPQTGQWALSHAIYPGLVFDKQDFIVQGHIKLMQACTKEDVPAETGWLHHGGLWTYNAPFVAHVYLWAGLKDWGRMTFNGFLNHASPLYCWREEQPLRGSLVAGYVGDMPHNWASAECVLYLRHMLALEDDEDLRLLAGIGDFELLGQDPFTLDDSPTKFGRVSMKLEPLDRKQGWKLIFKRGTGPTPASVQLPLYLGRRFHFVGVENAPAHQKGNIVLVAPETTSWIATWKA
ncbi:MAG: hypothetical protein M1404_06415 [Acidobacteria bacterium]|nr:hypothetical protein [Acidobacteriota bacterium]